MFGKRKLIFLANFVKVAKVYAATNLSILLLDPDSWLARSGFG